MQFILNNQVNTGQLEQEKKQILMKDNERTISHSFFIRTILKEQDLLENKTTINAEVNKKTYPSLENRNVL